MSKIEEEPLKSSQYELSLLVDNKPIREYHHEGNVFVEGRSGSEYKIRIKNNTGNRTCFVVSVDGLSVLNGKQCANDSPGYILGPWESLDIACYKVNDETGARFVFGSKDKSYTVQIGEGGDNVGVIGAMVYRELVRPIHIHRPPPFRPWPQPRPWDDGYPRRRYAGAMAASARLTKSANRSSSLGEALYSANVNSSITTNSTGPMLESGANAEEPLGTIFGGAMEWKTETVKFERENSATVSMAIYYDTRKNLERRGVKLEQKVPPLPNAFPGNGGCTPPDNWQK